MEDDSRGVKPNSAFLGRLLNGVERGNQRVLDTNASRAALKAVGCHAAASLRPALQKASKQGRSVRHVALTAAAQQKLVLCSALLREVALTFGFKLRISNPYGVESSPSIFTGAAAGPSGASTGASEPGVEPPEDQATAGVGLEGVEQGSSTQPAVGAAGAKSAGLAADVATAAAAGSPGLDWVQLMSLDVDMLLGNDDGDPAYADPAYADDGEGAQATGVLPSPRSRALARRKALAATASVRPKLAIGSRLTSNALNAVGLVTKLRAGAAQGASAPGMASLLAAKRRALLIKRQGSGGGSAPAATPTARGVGAEGDGGPATTSADMGPPPPVRASPTTQPCAAATAAAEEATCSGKGGARIVWAGPAAGVGVDSPSLASPSGAAAAAEADGGLSADDGGNGADAAHAQLFQGSDEGCMMAGPASDAGARPKRKRKLASELEAEVEGEELPTAIGVNQPVRKTVQPTPSLFGAALRGINKLGS